MKAISIKEFGDRSVLQLADVEKPVPGEGEVLLRIRAAGVNPVDAKIREGKLQGRMPNILPVIPGWDMAGEVLENGHSARRFKPGDNVWAYARRTVIQHGTYAEYITLPESYITRKPDSLNFEEAAAVPLAALTAYQSVIDQGKLSAGQHLLVLGASGGVGSFAVQFGKAVGATVTAVAGSGREEYLHSIGADQVIDYTKGDVVEQFRKLNPEGADVVYDCVGGDTSEKAYECARENGRVVSILAQVNEELAARHKVHFRYVFVEPNVTELDQISEWIDAGKVKVHIQQVYDLKDAPAAHEQIETGHTLGKIVLRIP